jgi:hypothetical protein
VQNFSMVGDYRAGFLRGGGQRFLLAADAPLWTCRFAAPCAPPSQARGAVPLTLAADRRRRRRDGQLAFRQSETR